jgi:hypothetical protein
MPMTVSHLKNNIVLMTLSKYNPTDQLPDVFIPKILLLFTLLHRKSLLFFNETITILADGISYSLFDLGLGVTNF